jgi:hypothetical protein
MQFAFMYMQFANCMDLDFAYNTYILNYLFLLKKAGNVDNVDNVDNLGLMWIIHIRRKLIHIRYFSFNKCEDIGINNF